MKHRAVLSQLANALPYKVDCRPMAKTEVENYEYAEKLDRLMSVDERRFRDKQ